MRTYAILRAYHTSEDPQNLTNALGVDPSAFHTRGSADNSVGVEAEDSMWSWSTEQSVQSDSVEDHLMAVVKLVKARQAEFLASRGAGWDFDIMAPWTSYGYDGPQVGPGTMRGLADLELAVWFPIHHEQEHSQ